MTSETSTETRHYTVAVIGGTGPQGKGLGYRFARHGHDIILGSRAAEKGGAHAISLCNTWRGLAVDVETGRKILEKVISSACKK